jgi:hydroxyacylglutathione hydrolase
VAYKVNPKPGAPTLEPVARGVWCVRGGVPKRGMNVFLLEDDGGVTMFDAGIRDMRRPLGDICERMGGLKRTVLGHAHPDHRGTAPGLGAPVYCHPDERGYAEGDGGMSDWHPERLDWWGKWLPPVNRHLWDGGPVRVEGTVEEGDEVAGFEVVHLPGHSPGLIALWRAEDRLALVTDAFYLLDPQTTQAGKPRVAHAAFNLDTDQARESVRKLAALGPREAWPGHLGPLTGDVRGQLERAADGPVAGEG